MNGLHPCFCRIHTVGKEVVDIEIQEASTLLHVAQAVEDKWGTPVDDMAFRFKGQSLTPAKHGKKVRLPNIGCDACELLARLSATTPHESAN